MGWSRNVGMSFTSFIAFSSVNVGLHSFFDRISGYICQVYINISNLTAMTCNSNSMTRPHYHIQDS